MVEWNIENKYNFIPIASYLTTNKYIFLLADIILCVCFHLNL